MKKMLLSLFILASLSVFAIAQDSTSPSQAPQNTEGKPKKPTFRANKDQILHAQKLLKVTETGKLTKEDRDVVKTYQKENGLKASGSLNRATLEKMGIALTAKQQEIPANPNDFAKAKQPKMEAKKDSTESTDPKTEKARKAVFRATKEQVMQAQKIVGMPETGKLSKEDREALKKYQTDNGIKVTGTLNKLTLEKMGIELNEKQKDM